MGLLGTLLSASRGEWARARRGVLTLVLVAAGYLGVLLAISLRQPGTVVPAGHSRCFNTVCFEVVAAEEPTGFRPRAPNAYSTPLPNNSGSAAPDRLLRLRIAITNTATGNDAEGEPGLIPVLQDAQGRSWPVVPGLAGLPLSTPIQGRRTAIASPVFRVAPESTGLHLLLRHTGWYAGRLTLGNPESLLHRPERMALPPTSPLPPPPAGPAMP